MAASTKSFNLSSAAKSAPPTVTMAERNPKLRPQPPLQPPEPSFLLHKQRTWSPDIDRNEEWARLKRNQKRRFRSHSVVTVTDDDMKELKAGIDLGFGFDTPNLDPKLSRTFPALHLYSAVNRLSRSSSSVSSESSSESSDSSPSLSDFLDPKDDGSEKMKVKLKQWAQAVACSVREAAPAKLVI